MTSPVPMNRAERRKQKAKIAPENTPFTLALLSRREVTGEDGVVRAQSFFALVAPNGQRLMEETDHGPMPVIVASIPQGIKRSLLAGSSLVVTR